MNDKELAEWIEDNVGFPNGMVDRIVPKTTDVEREYLREKFGYEDEWPIFCEPFKQVRFLSTLSRAECLKISTAQSSDVGVAWGS